MSIYCSSKSYAQQYAEKEDLNYVITDGEAEQSFLYKNRIPLLCVVLVCILCVGVTVAVILSHKRRQITACAEEGMYEMPVNYCPSCGRKARPGDRYCRGCGKMLE